MNNQQYQLQRVQKLFLQVHRELSPRPQQATLLDLFLSHWTAPLLLPTYHIGRQPNKSVNVKKPKRDNTLLQQKGNSQIQIPTIIVPENILPASDTANTILDYQPTLSPEIIRPPVYTTRSTAKLAAVMAASVVSILFGVF